MNEDGGSDARFTSTWGRPPWGVLVSMTLQGETPVGVSPRFHWDMASVALSLATSLSFSFLRSKESLIVGDSRRGIETAYLGT